TALPQPSNPILYNSNTVQQTFFGVETSKMVSIQVLPLSGASYYLAGLNQKLATADQTIAFNNAYIDQNVAYGFYAPSQIGKVPAEPPQFATPLYAYQAFSDPNTAIANYIQAYNNSDLQLFNANGVDNYGYTLAFMRVLQ